MGRIHLWECLALFLSALHSRLLYKLLRIKHNQVQAAESFLTG